MDALHLHRRLPSPSSKLTGTFHPTGQLNADLPWVRTRSARPPPSPLRGKGERVVFISPPHPRSGFPSPPFSQGSLVLLWAPFPSSCPKFFSPYRHIHHFLRGILSHRAPLRAVAKDILHQAAQQCPQTCRLWRGHGQQDAQGLLARGDIYRDREALATGVVLLGQRAIGNQEDVPAFSAEPPKRLHSWTAKGLNWGDQKEVELLQRKVKAVVDTGLEVGGYCPCDAPSSDSSTPSPELLRCGGTSRRTRW